MGRLCPLNGPVAGSAKQPIGMNPSTAPDTEAVDVGAIEVRVLVDFVVRRVVNIVLVGVVVRSVVVEELDELKIVEENDEDED